MRTLIPLFVLFSVFAWAQNPAPPGAASQEQQAPASPAAEAKQPFTPETVVAVVNGKPVTAAEMNQMLLGAVGPVKQSAAQDPKEFLVRFYTVEQLAEDAARLGLDKTSPYKERLAFQRSQILMQARIDDYFNRVLVEEHEMKKAYETGQSKYSYTNVKVIYISYSATPPPPGPDGKKVLNEEEAMALAGEILAKIRGGEDFVKLVKQYSEHADSRADNGDFGSIRPADKVPDEIKNAVLALKEGQVSEPVKLTNGIYLFRAEKVAVSPYAEVREKIYEELRQERFRQWLEKMRGAIAVEVKNKTFFEALGANPK